MRLSFEDSLRGVETKIPVELTVACSQCGGTGAKPGTAPIICPECNGRGVISETQGLFALSQPCPRCRGNGTVIEKPCPKCHGSGRERRRRTFTVKIKPGVKDGTKIRLKGKGEAGANGGPNGDLVVVTRVEPSDDVRAARRRPRRRRCRSPSRPPRSAARSRCRRRKAPSRSRSPPGSEDGKLLRIKGRGAPKLTGLRQGRRPRARADPGAEALNKKERELLEELQKAGG